jgi:hypothetical protein
MFQSETAMFHELYFLLLFVLFRRSPIAVLEQEGVRDEVSWLCLLCVVCVFRAFSCLDIRCDKKNDQSACVARVWEEW